MRLKLRKMRNKFWPRNLIARYFGAWICTPLTRCSDAFHVPGGETSDEKLERDCGRRNQYAARRSPVWGLFITHQIPYPNCGRRVSWPACSRSVGRPALNMGRRTAAGKYWRAPRAPTADGTQHVFVSFAESYSLGTTSDRRCFLCNIVLWGWIQFQGVDQTARGARARFRSFILGAFLKTLSRWRTL